MQGRIVTGRKAFKINIRTKLISYLPKEENRQTKCEVGKMDLQAILNIYNKYEEWYVKIMLKYINLMKCYIFQFDREYNEVCQRIQCNLSFNPGKLSKI